jgi:hypothetical protein
MPMNIQTGAAFDEAMEWAIAQWVAARPAEVADFDEALRWYREQGQDRSFWSGDKQFRWVGEIPTFVHSRMCERLGSKDWLSDKRLRDRFLARFKDFRLDSASFSGTVQSSRA